MSNEKLPRNSLQIVDNSISVGCQTYNCKNRYKKAVYQLVTPDVAPTGAFQLCPECAKHLFLSMLERPELVEECKDKIIEVADGVKPVINVAAVGAQQPTMTIQELINELPEPVPINPTPDPTPTTPTTPPKKYKCDFCDEHFDTPAQKAGHIRSKHRKRN